MLNIYWGAVLEKKYCDIEIKGKTQCFKFISDAK